MDLVSPLLYIFVAVIGGTWALFKFLSRSLEKKMDAITDSVQQKLDKQEHQLALARIDRDMDRLRDDQNNRLDRIVDAQVRTESKLDRLNELIIEHLKK